MRARQFRATPRAHASWPERHATPPAAGDWAKYKGGVLSGSCKAKANLIDHCVQLVGFDKTVATPYFKVRRIASHRIA